MPKPKSKNALSWANAVKMWNMHKKIYDPTHVYAMPRKGTAEYDDAKHVQVHGALPIHLHRKAPFPAAALEQLRKHEKESEARREISKREKVIELIKAATPAKAEPAPKIVVPPLPARLEKKEEARLEVEPAKTKLTPTKEKVIAEILEAHKEHKAKIKAAPKVVQTPQGKAKLSQALEDLGKELDALPEPEEKEEADPFTSRYFTVASRKPLHLRKSHLKVEDQGTIELKKELQKNREILSTIKDPAERKKFIWKAEKEQKDNGNILYDKLKELGAVPTDRNKVSLRKMK